MNPEQGQGITIDRTKFVGHIITCNGFLQTVVAEGPWHCVVNGLMAAARQIHARAVIGVDCVLGNPEGDSVIWHYRETGEACDEEGTPLNCASVSGWKFG